MGRHCGSRAGGPSASRLGGLSASRWRRLTGYVWGASVRGLLVASTHGLRVVARAAGLAGTGRRSSRQGGRGLRRAQRLVDQRVLTELSRELGERGWIGMTWPAEYGGGGRTADRAVCGDREADRSGCTDRRVVVRRSPDGPDADRLRQPRPEADDSCRASSPARPTWCIGMSEPERRLRPRLTHDQGRARRRQLRHQRPEDLDELRRRRRLLLPDLPHVDRGPAPRRHQRDHRADGHARASRSARSRT